MSRTGNWSFPRKAALQADRPRREASNQAAVSMGWIDGLPMQDTAVRCGRAYGTGCQHEHACVRCALLRPDPSQIDRLQDIIDNLGERIAEAEQHGWIGDVEGLRVTLNSAELKLAQMYKLQSRNDREVVELGIPRTRT